MWECAAVVSHYLNWCAASPQQPHDVWSLGPQALANGLVMAGILFGLFLVQERYKSRRRRSEYARSIYQELDRMRARLWPEFGMRLRLRPDDGVVRDLPRSTYEGLISSAAISTLSDGLQRQLGNFYGSLREGRVDIVRGRIPDLMRDVNRERKNAEDWWLFWKRRA